MRGLKAGRRAAALLLLFACCCLARAQNSTGAAIRRSGDVVIFHGQINPRSVEDFKRVLQEGGIARLVITSPGGSVAAALEMALAVHERGLDIEVPAQCLSSCANYVFPSARRKLIGRPGAVAWHGNMTHVLYLQQSGKAAWSEGEMRSARELAKREADFFRRIGVDGFVCWFAKIAPYDVDESYYLSVADMERFGIRDVVLRDAQPRADTPLVRKVVVDWTNLEAGRPEVKPDE